MDITKDTGPYDLKTVNLYRKGNMFSLCSLSMEEYIDYTCIEWPFANQYNFIHMFPWDM